MNFDVDNLVRNNVRLLKPYSTARDEFKGKAEVYLDANENPHNTSLNRYPDPGQQLLKMAIAKLKNIEIDQIILGNGSDEVIDLLIRAFCEPVVNNVIIPQPTYGMYAVYAHINNVEIRQPCLTPSFELDNEEIFKCIDSFSKIIFLCSPNNPTGNLSDKSKIVSLLESFNGLVIIDEAYIDFAEGEGFLGLLSNHPNLFVLQTFSKAWGLAGIRVGVGYGSKAVISLLSKIKAPYNINSLSAQAALMALKNQQQKNENVKSILTERNKLEKKLAQFSFVQNIYPSQANFLLVQMKNAGSCYSHLLKNGIIVRDRSAAVNCENCLRITIGTPLENNLLIESLTTYEKSLIY